MEMLGSFAEIGGFYAEVQFFGRKQGSFDKDFTTSVTWLKSSSPIWSCQISWASMRVSQDHLSGTSLRNILLVVWMYECMNVWMHSLIKCTALVWKRWAFLGNEKLLCDNARLFWWGCFYQWDSRSHHRLNFLKFHGKYRSALLYIILKFAMHFYI